MQYINNRTIKTKKIHIKSDFKNSCYEFDILKDKTLSILRISDKKFNFGDNTMINYIETIKRIFDNAILDGIDTFLIKANNECDIYLLEYLNSISKTQENFNTRIYAIVDSDFQDIDYLRDKVDFLSQGVIKVENAIILTPDLKNAKQIYDIDNFAKHFSRICVYLN